MANVFIYLSIIASGLIVLWILAALQTQTLIAQLSVREDREVGCSITEQVIRILADDLGISQTKIHLNDELRETLGYDYESMSGEDAFDDLEIVLEPLEIKLEVLRECLTVSDLIAAAKSNIRLVN